MHPVKSFYALAAWMAICCSATFGQSIVRIEEDWEMHVLEPDLQVEAPQAVTTLLPFGTQSDILFQLDINHGSEPDYDRGGLQIKILDDDFLLDEYRIAPEALLSHDAETLRWTLFVQKVQGGVFFGVEDGQSLSFGDFGGVSSGTFISDDDAGAANLQSYHHSNSLVNSGVSYAGNRVGWLRLKRVVVFGSDGSQTAVTVNGDVDLN